MKEGILESSRRPFRAKASLHTSVRKGASVQGDAENAEEKSRRDGGATNPIARQDFNPIVPTAKPSPTSRDAGCAANGVGRRYSIEVDERAVAASMTSESRSPKPRLDNGIFIPRVMRSRHPRHKREAISDQDFAAGRANPISRSTLAMSVNLFSSMAATRLATSAWF